MADLGTLEELDNFSGVRNALRVMAAKVDEFAGIPLPIDGEELVIEPSYPFASVIGRKEKPPADNQGWTLRSSFYYTAKRADIFIWEKDGKIDWTFAPAVHHFDYDFRTLGCSFAWGIEQEAAAVQLLGTLVTHVQFKQYMLTGMFLESSRRSNVGYMFRRLKPTVAIGKDPRSDTLRLLCTLCMHPIAYYAGSWAGAMCPTDDVIAHLMLMRGDEPMFWRRCNQHPPFRPEAGL